MDKGEKRIHTKIVLGALVILVAMVMWVLLGTSMWRT